MLTINNLTKTYQGQQPAVSGLNVTIAPGEIFGFIGHNGAGKTTTLKAVVGILPFESGEILIDGHSIQTEPIACKQLLAYVPDNPDLYEHLTGLQYLTFIADIFGLSAATRSEKIQKYADAFELTPDLGALVASYSHGMKQKLALIGALIHDPKLLVLDEPFVGLDPKASHTLRQLMSELCQQGSAIFFSTHVLEVAEKLCHRIGMIHHGRLAFTGTMRELLAEKQAGSLEEIFLEIVAQDE